MPAGTWEIYEGQQGYEIYMKADIYSYKLCVFGLQHSSPKRPSQKSIILQNLKIIFKATEQLILANHHEHFQYICLAFLSSVFVSNRYVPNYKSFVST